MFTKYGDITVVKTDIAEYWIEFESLDTCKKFNTIQQVGQHIKKSNSNVIDIKMFDEAKRFESVNF